MPSSISRSQGLFFSQSGKSALGTRLTSNVYWLPSWSARSFVGQNVWCGLRFTLACNEGVFWAGLFIFDFFDRGRLGREEVATLRVGAWRSRRKRLHCWLGSLNFKQLKYFTQTLVMSFLSLRLAQIIPRMYNPIIVQKVASSAGCLWSSANFLIEALMSSLFGGMNKSAPNHVKCEHWQRVRWRLVWLWTCKIMGRRWLDVAYV